MEFRFPYSSFLSLLSIIIFFISFKLLVIRSKTSQKKLPPSPPALPILGHLHLMINLKQPFHTTLYTLSLKHGSVFSLWFGSHYAVIVSSPSAVQECFNKNDIIFANRPQLIATSIYNYTSVALAPYGDNWRNLRRICALEIFSSSRLNSFMGIRRDEIRILLEKLCAVGRDGFAKVELRPMFSEMTLNIIMRMVAGKVDQKAKELLELTVELFESAGTSNVGNFFPFFRWIDYKGSVQRSKIIGGKLDLSMQALIDEHRSNHEDDCERRNSMISHLLSLQESQPEYYTDELIKGLIVSVVVGASDTSSVTLEWAISNLLNHPRVLNKARAELENQIGLNQSLIDESDLSKLPYLHNIISETLRLYPAAPLLLPHLSSDDCTIEGYHIPSGTMLLVNAWAIQRDPMLWVDPTRFWPERFEGGECTTHKLLPFGQGRRVCPGMGLAQRILGLTLSSLVMCFDWERVDGKKVEMSGGTGLTMPKAVPLEAMCKARSIVNKIISEAT